MSTRGAICFGTRDDFRGRYHHWDSYPSGLGASLYYAYHSVFDKDIKRMEEYLIDDHPAGWSSINDISKDTVPGFNGPGAQCYCHGGRNEEGTDPLTKDNVGEGIEYWYIIDGTTVRIYIERYFQGEFQGQKVLGMFGMGPKDIGTDDDVILELFAEFDLNDPEPDWAEMEKQDE